jgi:hypothetical protein
MKNFKAFLGVLVLFSILLFTPKATSQFQLHLSPLLVELDIAPGATKSYKLHIRNEDKENGINLWAYATNMRETQRGAYEVAEDETTEYSCVGWVQIRDSILTLEPGESRDIEVKVKAPRDVFGGRYAAVVFEVVPPEATFDSYGMMRLHYKMPTFLEVTIKRFGGLQRKASIVDFQVTPFSSEKLKDDLGEEALSFTASVKNEGNIHVEGKGTLIIKDREGKTKRRVPLGGGRGIVIPGATVDFSSFLRKPLPGEYVAKAMINFGGLSPMVAEIPFSISRTKSAALGSFKASSFIALDIKPVNLEMKIPQRGFRAMTFSLANEERDSVEIKAYLKDMDYDEEGNLVVLDSSETGRSCIDWVNLEPEEFTIAPGKSSRTRINLQAPDEGAGGYYACLVFDALLKSSTEGAISSPFQIPVIVNVPTGLEEKGEIVDLQISAALGKPATFVTLFKNLGNTHIKPRGKIRIDILRELQQRDDIIFTGEPKYERLAELELEEVDQYILPGGTRIMQAGFMGSLEAGKYMAEVSINFGGSQPAVYQKAFTIK